MDISVRIALQEERMRNTNSQRRGMPSMFEAESEDSVRWS